MTGWADEEGGKHGAENADRGDPPHSEGPSAAPHGEIVAVCAPVPRQPSNQLFQSAASGYLCAHDPSTSTRRSTLFKPVETILPGAA